MSTLITDVIAGPRDLNHLTTVPRGTTFSVPGTVIQTVWKEYHDHQSVTASNDNVSRDLSGLNVDITLKKSNSLVYIKWYLFYEGHYDITFQAKRNGTVIGFNSEVGNVRYSGIGSGEYEHSFDQSSTPSYLHMCYVDTPGSVGPHTYSLGVRGSGPTNQGIILNRAWGGYSDDVEGGVSWCIIQEVGQ